MSKIMAKSNSHHTFQSKSVKNSIHITHFIHISYTFQLKSSKFLSKIQFQHTFHMQYADTQQTKISTRSKEESGQVIGCVYIIFWWISCDFLKKHSDRCTLSRERICELMYREFFQIILLTHITHKFRLMYCKFLWISYWVNEYTLF